MVLNVILLVLLWSSKYKKLQRKDKIMKRNISICMLAIILISMLLFGCDLTTTSSDNVIITMPNGEKYEVEDKITQGRYLALFEEKQEVENKPGYFSTENKYIVDYKMDGQQGTFEFYIQPTLLEVIIEFNNRISKEEAIDIIAQVLSTTELELEDLVLTDAIGFPIDVKDSYGSYKNLRFEYSRDGPWKIANTNEPIPCGVVFSFTSTKKDILEKLIKQLENSNDGIERTKYKKYDFVRTPVALVRHLYKGFIIDNEANWYRIPDSEMPFLVEQDKIYSSLIG